jgi:anti-anti-sigma factor
MVEIIEKRVDGIKHLTINGKIDMSSAEKCKEMLVQGMANEKSIVFDLSGILFIDSTGISKLLYAVKTAYDTGIKFEIINIPEVVHEIFEVIGVYDVIKVWHTDNVEK